LGKPYVIIFRDRGNIRKYFGDKDYEKSSKRENSVAYTIKQLSNNRLPVKYAGYGAGVSKKYAKHIPYSESRSMDLLVGGTAIVEVMGSERYNFERSNFFPVAMDKVERAKKSKIPAYFVFVLDRESQPNKWWIKGVRCNVYELAYGFPTIYGHQDIYKTNKNDWHRGLQTLIDELLKIAKIGAES